MVAKPLPWLRLIFNHIANMSRLGLNSDQYSASCSRIDGHSSHMRSRVSHIPKWPIDHRIKGRLPNVMSGSSFIKVSIANASGNGLPILAHRYA